MLTKESLQTGFHELVARPLRWAAEAASGARRVISNVLKPKLQTAHRILSRHFATILTALRVALGAVGAFAFAAQSYGSALGLFVVSAFLDGLDGHVARRLNRVSAFGAFLDVAGDWIVLVAYSAVMFRFGILTVVSLALLMFAVSLRIIAHFISFFEQGGFTAQKDSLEVPSSATGTISTVLAYSAGVFGTLDALLPGFFRRHLGVDASVILLFVSIFSALFALLFLLVTLRSPSRAPRDGQLPFNVHASEPLIRMLLDRFQLRPLDVGLCFEVVFTMPLFVTAIAVGLFSENAQYKGIFWTYSQLWGYSLILPLISALAAELYLSAPAASVSANNLVNDPNWVKSVEVAANAFYHDRMYILLIAGVTVVAEVLFRLDMIHNHVHSFFRNAHINIVECLETVVHAVSVYLVICVLVYGTATLVFLTRILRRADFTLQVFHEDRYVGIAPVIHLLTIFNNVVLLVLVEFVLTIADAVRHHLPIVMMHLVVFLFGLVALPILTLIPVWVVHERLVSARRNWTTRLNLWFRDASVINSLDQKFPSGAAFPPELSSFAKAHEVMRAIDSIPMWPFPAYKALGFAAKIVFTAMAFGASIQEIRH